MFAVLALFGGLSGGVAYTVLAGHNSPTQSFLAAHVGLEALAVTAGFGLDEVTVTGHRFTNDLDVFDALDMPHARLLPGFDVAAARARIERLPWVSTAEITRVWPGRLDIRITERTPYAIWQRGDHHHLIDIGGRVLSAVKPEDYERLPRVSGEGAATETAALLTLVERYPSLARRLRSAERIAERRWSLHLAGNVTVHLPADREAVALEDVADGQALSRLLEVPGSIVDLRSSRRVTTRPASPQRDRLAQGGS